MLLKIPNHFLQDGDAFFYEPNGKVAGTTKESPDLFRAMTVIYHEMFAFPVGFFSSAYGTLASLRLEHDLVLSESKPPAVFECVTTTPLDFSFISKWPNDSVFVIGPYCWIGLKAFTYIGLTPIECKLFFANLKVCLFIDKATLFWMIFNIDPISGVKAWLTSRTPTADTKAFFCFVEFFNWLDAQAVRTKLCCKMLVSHFASFQALVRDGLGVLTLDRPGYSITA